MSLYTTPNVFPLKLSESISTRPSTLVEYQATYAIQKNSEVPAQFQTNQGIIVNGTTVYIFPGPQISRSNEVMWDTLTLTAYGDAPGSSSRTIYGSSITEVSKSFSVTSGEGEDEQTYNWTIYESWRTDTATAIRAISSASTLLPIVSSPPTPTFRRRRTIGTVAPGGQQILNISWALSDLDISRTNFGKIDEVSLTKGYLPTVS